MTTRAERQLERLLYELDLDYARTLDRERKQKQDKEKEKKRGEKGSAQKKLEWLERQIEEMEEVEIPSISIKGPSTTGVAGARKGYPDTGETGARKRKYPDTGR